MLLLGTSNPGLSGTVLGVLERAIGARDFALCNATTHQGESQARSDGRSDFENVPHSMFSPLESWQNGMFGRSGFDAWDLPCFDVGPHVSTPPVVSILL